MVVLMALTMMISAPIMAIGGIFMALRMNARLSLLLVVILPHDGRVHRRDRHAGPCRCSARCRSRSTGINRVLRETLSGIRVIRAFDRTAYEERRFAEANDDLTATTLRVTRLFALMMPDDHAGPEPLHRRGHVVREPPGGRRATCRSATSPPSSPT